VTYRLTPRAIKDIDAIADYLSERNPAAAIELISGFMRRLEMLAVHPYSGPSRDKILPGLRHLVLGPYLAPYRVEEGNAVILRILDGRQNIEDADVG
jgi:plasmid stabilization system protein ParE